MSYNRMAGDYEYVRSTAVNALWTIIEELQPLDDLTRAERNVLQIAKKAHQAIAETYTFGGVIPRLSIYE